jgi:hypothetical protein
MEPSLKQTLLGAVHQALGGDWQAAHLVAQDHEGEPLANWLHAVVHRMEGDVGNASYWYRRCGRTLRQQVSTEAELKEIEAALSE